jgi:hypothetical protein
MGVWGKGARLSPLAPASAAKLKDMSLERATM